MNCEDCGKQLVFKTTQELKARMILGWMHYSSTVISQQTGTMISRNDLRGLATCECGAWYVEYHKRRARSNTVAKIKGHKILFDINKMEMVASII